jgi:hypothetical protein
VVGTGYPIVLADVQGARTGTMTFTTLSLSERTAFLSLMTLGQPVLIQGNSDPVAGDGFADMYFMVGNIAEQRVAGSSTDPTRKWQVSFNEVISPSGTLTSIPGNSWNTVQSFNTWQAVVQYRANWLAVLDVPYGQGNPV